MKKNMFENRLVKLCFASNPYKLTKIYSVCRKHTFGRVRRDDLITKVNGYNWQFLPGIISFLRSFCTDHLYSFTQIFPLVVHFFSKIIEEGCVWYNKKHRFPNLYKYIYVYVYILHICFNNLGSIAQKRKYNSVSTMPREDD